MHKIGNFSLLAKVTVKTLRYYEKKNLLLPAYIDRDTGYRYYKTEQLLDLVKIISLKQLGLSLNEIKLILDGTDMDTLIKFRKIEIIEQLSILNEQLQRINILLKGEKMNYEVFKKDLPECMVYYREGQIKGFFEITDFIKTTIKEFKNYNPNCNFLEPDYCFLTYLDGEYRETNIKVRYVQAINKLGNNSSNIKFMTLKSTEAICIYHKGSYTKFRDSYTFIMKWIDDNDYIITDFPRERYIDGIWNKDCEDEYLTEIQVPVKLKS